MSSLSGLISASVLLLGVGGVFTTSSPAAPAVLAALAGGSQTLDIRVTRSAPGQLGLDLDDNSVVMNIVPGSDCEGKLHVADRIVAVDGESTVNRWAGDVVGLHPNASGYTFTVERLPDSGRPSAAVDHSQLPSADFGGNCTDTPGWANDHSFDCEAYAARGWCYGGALVSGQEWTGGAAHQFPEQNCCVCGSGNLSQAILVLPPLTINGRASGLPLPSPAAGHRVVR